MKTTNYTVYSGSYSTNQWVSQPSQQVWDKARLILHRQLISELYWLCCDFQLSFLQEAKWPETLLVGYSFDNSCCKQCQVSRV